VLGLKGAGILRKEGVTVRKFIFITPEGLTHKPNCDSPDPDFQDIQIIGFGGGSTVEEALNDLMELNEGTFESKSERNIALRIEDNKYRSLWARGHKTKIPKAS
jgi:hypothetical protein